MQYINEDQDIRILVEPTLDEAQSSSQHNYYFYTYTVTIENHSSKTVQLKSRKWIIKDGSGNEDCVEGEGVIGQQPEIAPGDSFTYTSFCPLRTSTGNMRGHYTFQGDKNEFKVGIPLFFLRSPESFGAASELQ